MNRKERVAQPIFFDRDGALDFFYDGRRERVGCSSKKESNALFRRQGDALSLA